MGLWVLFPGLLLGLPPMAMLGTAPDVNCCFAAVLTGHTAKT